MIADISGIIVDGGAKVNIIPERSVLHIAVRAPTDAELRQLESRVKHIFESAAVATGCQVIRALSFLC